jgi:hypothetical protein
LKRIEYLGVDQRPDWLPCWKELIGGKEHEQRQPGRDAAPLPPDLVVGDLKIVNQMGEKEDVVVNGVRYSIGPGESDLWISRGVVYAHVPESEPIHKFPPRNWTWNGRNYEMKLIIQNKSLRPANWQYPSGYMETVPGREYPPSGGPVAAPTPLMPQPASQPTLAPPKPAEPILP